jgi:hypothetical protein
MAMSAAIPIENHASRVFKFLIFLYNVSLNILIIPYLSLIGIAEFLQSEVIRLYGQVFKKEQKPIIQIGSIFPWQKSSNMVLACSIENTSVIR